MYGVPQREPRPPQSTATASSGISSELRRAGDRLGAQQREGARCGSTRTARTPTRAARSRSRAGAWILLIERAGTIIVAMTDVLSRIGLRRMTPRDPAEPHRVATPLELLFDLVFVVAVSQASQNLHHLISEDHVGQGVLSLPHGVLRDLVGVDELHVVRVGLRHGRLALPGHDDRADGGRARARRRRARGDGRLRLHSR